VNSTWIDVKQAVLAAEVYVRALYPEAELHTLRREEVVRSDDGYRSPVTRCYVPLVSPDGIRYLSAPIRPRCSQSTHWAFDVG